MTTTRVRLFLLFAAVAAAVCIRLGFWQLSRLHERRARNALVASRVNAEPIDVRELPRDTSGTRFRRVRVAGTIDYDHELVHAARTRRGSPGVHIFTPVRIPGSDTAVLVNRGWVYSPDGSTVDLSKWHDRDSVFIGYAVELQPTGGSAFSDRPNTLAKLGYDAVAKALPYPVSETYVVALAGDDTTSAADRIARLTIPALDDGPHLSYATQWFGFASVALVGAVIVLRQQRGGGSGRRTSPRHDASRGDDDARR